MLTSKRAPEIFLAAWFTILAFGIWLHTHATSQLPLGDAFAYYLKAQHVWFYWGQGIWLNPFNIGPVFRPPGTVLITAPLGFTSDPRWFFFRAVYFPAIILGASVIAAAYSRHAPASARWFCISTAIFFSTLPMFYGFEINPDNPDPNVWGLVDPLLTACAAFATACAWRSVTHPSDPRTLIWPLLTGFSAAFCITVKPSGVVVAALVGLTWFCLTLLTTCWRAPKARTILLRTIFTDGICVAAPILIILEDAVSSTYLSGASFAQGQANVAIMKAELRITPPEFLFLANHSFGILFILWAGLSAFALLTSAPNHLHQRRLQQLALGGAISLIAFGTWFWLVATGGATEIRYGMPFFAMGTILLAGALGLAWGQFAVPLRFCLRAIMVLAICNLTALLYIPNPAFAWQAAAGVNVTAPAPRSAYESLLWRLSRAPRRNLTYIYALSVNFDYTIAMSITGYVFMHQPRPTLTLMIPTDWIHPSTYRIADIAGASYLTASYPPPSTNIGQNVPTFAAETDLLTEWADHLTPDDGVQILLSGPATRVLQINNKEKFTDALRQLVAAHNWRLIFRQANPSLFKPDPSGAP